MFDKTSQRSQFLLFLLQVLILLLTNPIIIKRVIEKVKQKPYKVILFLELQNSFLRLNVNH